MTYFPQDLQTSELKSNDLEEILANIRGILEKSTSDVVLLVNTDFYTRISF